MPLKQGDIFFIIILFYFNIYPGASNLAELV